MARLENKVSHQCIYLFVTGLDNLPGLLPFSNSLCARTFFSIACVGVRGKSNHHIFCDGCLFDKGLIEAVSVGDSRTILRYISKQSTGGEHLLPRHRK